MERELTIILTPSLPSRKSQIADYSGPYSQASIGNALIVLIEPAALPIPFYKPSGKWSSWVAASAATFRDVKTSALAPEAQSSLYGLSFIQTASSTRSDALGRSLSWPRSF
jgi:hypothetical protein